MGTSGRMVLGFTGAEWRGRILRPLLPVFALTGAVELLLAVLWLIGPPRLP